MQASFERILRGEEIQLNPEEFMNLKVHCSSVFNSLKQWLNLARTLYRIDVDQCLDLLTYVEKHQIVRHNYRDHTNNQYKIRIFYCLAALHLSKDNKVEVKEGNLFENTKKYINMAKNSTGNTFFTLYGFINYYQGNFSQALTSFTRASQTNQGDDSSISIIGMLGLAQTLFTKRNYQGALTIYKKMLRINKQLPAKARLGMAYCFYELEKYQMAKACFKRIIDLEPNNIEAILGYATIKYHEGQQQDYFPSLKKCYELNPNHPLVLLHISQHFFLIQSPKAKQVIEKGLVAVKSMPNFIDNTEQLRNDKNIIRCKLNYLLGQIYHKQGQFDTCLKYYSSALNKKLSYVRINFARAYINSNNFIQACKLIQEGIKLTPSKFKKLIIESYRTLAYIKSKAVVKKDRSQLDQSIHYYNQSLKYNSNDYQSFIEAGNVLLQNDIKKCKSYYYSAFEILKKQNRFIYPELLNNLGVLNTVKKNQVEAEKYFKLAFDQIQQWQKTCSQDADFKEIKLKSYHITFYYNLGILYEESSRFAEAIQCFEKCQSINPLYLDVYVRLAFVQYKRGDVNKALKILNDGEQIVLKTKNKYIIKDPLVFAKSYIYKQLGDQRKAKEYLKQCHNQPYKRIFQQSLDYDMLIQRGQSNTRNIKQILKQKIKPGLRIIQQDPHNFYGVLFFGVLAATLQKPIEAMICLNSLKQMDSQHPIILLNLGIYHYNNEQLDKSLILLKKYVDKIDHTDTTAELLISFILIIKGKFQQSIRIIKRLVMMFPQNLIFRYQLAYFIQKFSQKHLDAQNRQTKKVSQAIVFIKKIKVLYSFLSRVRQDNYTAHIQNPEKKEKVKQQILKMREKSDDQKMYIKSREDRFAFYQKDAENKQRILQDQKKLIQNRTKEVRERKLKLIEAQKRQKQEQLERRRERQLRQRQIEMRLNQQYLQEQQQNQRGKEQRKMRQGKGSKKTSSKKKKDDYDDWIEPDLQDNEVNNRSKDHDGDENDFVQAPKRSSGGGGRLKKKARNQSSDEQKYEMKNHKDNQQQNNQNQNDKSDNKSSNSNPRRNKSGSSNGNGNESQNQNQQKRMQVESPPSSQSEDAKERKLLRHLQDDQQ